MRDDLDGPFARGGGGRIPAACRAAYNNALVGLHGLNHLTALLRGWQGPALGSLSF